jgi:hypothetical protein
MEAGNCLRCPIPTLAMSINSVPGVVVAQGTPSTELDQCPAPAQAWVAPDGKAVTPDTGNAPKQEITTSEKNSPSPELPQDEVQVQRDSTTNGEIVVKYIDRSGNVIVQVPSTELLSLARSISQDFERQAKVRTTGGVAVSGEGDSIHGH